MFIMNSVTCPRGRRGATREREKHMPGLPGKTERWAHGQKRHGRPARAAAGRQKPRAKKFLEHPARALALATGTSTGTCWQTKGIQTYQRSATNIRIDWNILKYRIHDQVTLPKISYLPRLRCMPRLAIGNNRKRREASWRQKTSAPARTACRRQHALSR